jgi:hypothetical protein
MPLSRKQRLLNQLRGEEVDRVPAIGGWNLGVRNLAELAGIGVEEYLADPMRGVVRANLALGVDAVVPPLVPKELDSIRALSVQESSFEGVEPEALKARAEAIPDAAAKVLARFDAADEERKLRESFKANLAGLDGLELLTTAWHAPANFSLYFQYGYEAFLAAAALYPDEVEKIWWEDALLARERNRILARLMREYGVVPLLFCGHDLCLARGPMCSPAFLRKRYWPHAKASLEPLVEAGVRLVGHCDGDVLPIVDDMIAAGFSGFQGFQYEFGVDPFDLRRRLLAAGHRLPLFFAGLSVSRTLPWGTPADAVEEVEWFLDLTDGGRGMFLFTSNVTGVEVPPENLRAAYRHLAGRDPRQPRPGAGVPRPWPWGARHPEKAG